MGYATAQDYALQTGTDVPTVRVELLLEQASDAIDMEFRKRGRALPSDGGDELLLRLCRRVCCQLVERALASNVGGDVTQQTWTTGPFSRSMSFAPVGGNLKLNNADRSALGICGTAGFGGAAC